MQTNYSEFGESSGDGTVTRCFEIKVGRSDFTLYDKQHGLENELCYEKERY